MDSVSDEKDLGKRIKNGEDSIVVEGDLAKKVVRIKATGKVAWAIAIGGIGVAVTAFLSTPASGPAGPAVGLMEVAPISIALGGPSIAAAAFSIAVAGGGIGVLTSLKNKYNVEKISKEKIVLHKKK